jgi:DNA segregation ATPase FtsK/SpoIIIE, S-DNA-T family
VKVKKTQKKKYKRKESGFSHYNQEIIGILVFAFGVLVALSIYYKGSVGIFGKFIRELLLGFIGIPAFILPPLILLYSVFIIFKKQDRELKLRALYTFALIILVSSLIQTGFYKPEDYENLTPMHSIYMFYGRGIDFTGGGILGGLISAPFLMVFQTLGTIIILTTLAIIVVILLTNISIANFIRNINGLFVSSYKKSVVSLKERSENKKASKNREDHSDIVGEGEKLSLQFKPTTNIIDFNIQKNSRELKEKTDINGKLNEDISEVEPIEFIMKDMKKTTAEDVNRIKGKTELNKKASQNQEKETDENAKKGNKGENDIEKALSSGIHNHVNDYRYPSYDLLSENSSDGQDLKALKSSALDGARKLEDTLKSFGVEARVINVSRGPAVTRYELQPSPGVKVSKIVNLSDDISLNLAASGVRIEAPIPGKAAVGIEVPNKDVTAVFLREVIESDEFSQFQSKLSFAVGKDISGENIVADIAKMPHLLIAGATGAGKSVCINSLIISLLYKASPDEVKLLMVDPKVVELGVYNGIPHLLIPVVTDPKKAAGALNWAVQEMVNRYKLFAEKGVRDIKGYNAMLKSSGEEGKLPQIVIIIDELADLMMVAPNDVEDAICRLAQMARAAGMHLVIATQRPSVDVITGIIKANIPSRISFAVTSQVDSRTILDMAGAEKLLGKGDMLFYPVGEPKPIRIKGAFVSEKEVENVVEHVKSLGSAEYDENIIEEINSENEPQEKDPGDNDELLPQAIEMVVESGQASVSLIQRKFKVGYARAARIVDQMEERGVVGGYEGSKPRQVLMTRMQWQEMQMNNNGN